MKKISAVVAMLAVTAFAGMAFAGDVIEFAAPKKGKVTFPHKTHQVALKDCKKCHEKAPGKIAGFGGQAAGHALCKQCHTDMKAAGQKTGPTGCNDCHKK